MVIALIILLLAFIGSLVITFRVGSKLSAAKAEEARLNERVRTLETELQRHDDEVLRRESDETARFKAIASEILGANSKMLRDQHEERLDSILRPLRDNIAEFKRSVAEYYQKESNQRFSLQESIERLVKANDSITTEARELSRALRGDSKVQGDWGEMILESILEKSGLRRDEEFFVQLTHDDSGRTLRDDAGKALRPDVVVKYPGGRCIVIDSKVSLTSYADAVNATDDSDRNAMIDSHVRSVRTHIKELATKNYQHYVGSDTMDFVMMFIPNESAYMAAMHAAPALWQEAYDLRVLIVSPTHLVSALKLIAQLWSRDRRNRNAEEIAVQAGRLYDKFAGFVKDMDSIKKCIDNTEKAFSEAYGKLYNGRGNLISRVEQLRTLGAKAAKRLPETADSPDESDKD